MEQEAKDTSGITRSQQAMLVLPHGRAAVAQALGAPLQRIDSGVAETQLLVLAADADTTALATEVALEIAAPEVEILPVSSGRRAARRLREHAPQVVVGAPDDVLPLIQSTSLKLGGVRHVVLAWIDESSAGGGTPALDAIMAELPKDAARVMVVARLGDEAREIAERHVRRGLRGMDVAPADDSFSLAIQYMSVAATSRSTALRRLLDELDPVGAAVWVRGEESEREAQRAIAALGYRGTSAPVRVVRDARAGDAPLVVLYDIPASRAELQSVLAGGAAVPQVVALAQPRQLGVVRALAGAGAVAPLTLGSAGDEARRREERLRDELRTELEAGVIARELATLEPLLERYDGVEVAAVALRLLERSRASAARAPQPERAGGAAAPAGGRRAEAAGGTRIFLTVGERDGVRPGDLVGAIAGTAGITGENIGRIELRDTHSLVEIVGADAQQVAERITGSSIKGRRVVARLERERPPREGGARGFSGRGDRPPRDDRAPRSDRAPRGDRPMRPRGDRPDRPDRPDRRERPRRPPREDRGGA